MKKVFPILVLVVLTVFSCSKSDDDSNSTPSELLGVWNLTKFLTEEEVDTNGDGIKSNDAKSELPCLTVTHTFTANGIINSVSNDLDDTEETASCTEKVSFSGSFKENGDELTFLDSNNMETETFKFKIAAKTLTLIDNGDTPEEKITLVFTRQ